MRIFAVLLLLAVQSSVLAQIGIGAAPKRFGVEIDLSAYPQTTPQLTIKSVVNAISKGDLDYMLAHLVNPELIDEKVDEYKKLYKGPEKAKELVAFNDVVKQVQSHLRKDPTIVQELRRYVYDADGIEWKIDENKGEAFALLPDISSRRAMFKNIEGRWYLLNKRQ